MSLSSLFIVIAAGDPYSQGMAQGTPTVLQTPAHRTTLPNRRLVYLSVQAFCLYDYNKRTNFCYSAILAAVCKEYENIVRDTAGHYRRSLNSDRRRRLRRKRSRTLRLIR